MARAEEITAIYEDKSQIEKAQGCNGNLEFELIIFKNLLDAYIDSSDLFVIINQAGELNSQNSREGDCRLW